LRASTGRNKARLDAVNDKKLLAYRTGTGRRMPVQTVRAKRLTSRIHAKKPIQVLRIGDPAEVMDITGQTAEVFCTFVGLFQYLVSDVNAHDGVPCQYEWRVAV
jgi:hypothetical protein